MGIGDRLKRLERVADPDEAGSIYAIVRDGSGDPTEGSDPETLAWFARDPEGWRAWDRDPWTITIGVALETDPDEDDYDGHR